MLREQFQRLLCDRSSRLSEDELVHLRLPFVIAVRAMEKARAVGRFSFVMVE
jgi:hypothetical protein